MSGCINSTKLYKCKWNSVWKKWHLKKQKQTISRQFLPSTASVSIFKNHGKSLYYYKNLCNNCQTCKWSSYMNSILENLFFFVDSLRKDRRSPFLVWFIWREMGIHFSKMNIHFLHFYVVLKNSRLWKLVIHS